MRPPANPGFEVRFETPPGEQAQVDFAQFHVVFTDEPMTPRIIWLFSMVLGHSRLIWARFVMHQNLPTVLRCHIAAFEAIGGAPREVLYDRMKTAVIGEGQTEGIIYNALSSIWPAIMDSILRRARPTEPRQKARLSGRFGISEKTSSWLGRSAISTT